MNKRTINIPCRVLVYAGITIAALSCAPNQATGLLPSDKAIFKIIDGAPGIVKDAHKIVITASEITGNAVIVGQHLENSTANIDKTVQNISNLAASNTLQATAQTLKEGMEMVSTGFQASSDSIGKSITSLSNTKHDITNRIILDQEAPIKNEIKLDLNQAAWLRMGAAVLATGTFFTSLALIWVSLTKEQPLQQKVAQAVAGTIGMILSVAWLQMLRNESLTPSTVHPEIN